MGRGAVRRGNIGKGAQRDGGAMGRERRETGEQWDRDIQGRSRLTDWLAGWLDGMCLSDPEDEGGKMIKTHKGFKTMLF